MPTKVRLQDLQTNKIYNGTVSEDFRIGRTATIDLVGTRKPSVYLIQLIKGWVMSDSARLLYLIDGHGNRFKINVV
jgi:hypothetical protein